MTSLLLDEQSWLALLYFVVLPLLVVGIAVATYQRSGSEAGRRAAPQPLPAPSPSAPGAMATDAGRDAPIDPTPMLEDAPLHVEHSSGPVERVLALSATPVEAEEVLDLGNERASSEPDSEASARLATAQAHLQAAKARLQAQDDELDTLRAELDDAREALDERDRHVRRLSTELEARTAELLGLREKAELADQLRAELDRIRSGHDVAELATADLIPGDFDDDLELDDEIVVAMPGSAAEELEVDDDPDSTEETDGRLRPDRRASDDQLLTPQVLDRLAMAFDGTTECVVVEPSFSGLSREGWTIEAWIRPARTRLPRTVLSYAVAGSCRVRVSACGPRPALGVELDGESLPEDVQPRLIADVWQHVGVTWDAAGGRLTVYLDGALAFSGEVAPSARIPSGGRLILGQEPARGAQVSIPGRAYEGGLAEVRVWSHVRSPTEIQRDTHRRVPLQPELRVWRVG